MKAISVRGIEQEVSDKLKVMAQKHGKSVNQYVVDLIRQEVGVGKARKYSKEYDDLDHLFGRWSDSEFGRIQASIDRQRRIDRELWK